MALFNDLRGKLSQASQSTVSKVKDLSEIARLNGEITEAETQISELYSKIGFEIYKAYHEDPLPEVSDMISQVTQLHQKISDNKSLIQAINSANVCPQCGNKIKQGMAFCSGCGYKLPVQEPSIDSTLFCSNCGAAVAKGMAFCTSCGKKID